MNFYLELHPESVYIFSRSIDDKLTQQLGTIVHPITNFLV